SDADDNVIVLARGSTTETGSSLKLDQFDVLKFLTAVRRDAAGSPLASPELAEQILMPSPGGSLDNLAIRGMLPVGFAVHEQAHLISGRMFTPALSEIIIGRALVRRYRDCRFGARLHFGGSSCTSVGIF